MSINTVSGSSPMGLELKLQSALTGVQQTLPSGGALQLGGATATVTQIAQKLQGYLPPFQKVRDARTALAATVAARKADEALARDFLVELRGALVAFFGRNSPQMAQFGMSSKKAAKPTLETATLAAAKRALTRQQRGTRGKVAKLNVKTIGTPHVSLGAGGQTVAAGAVAVPAPLPATSAGGASAPVVPAPGVTQPAK